MFIFTLGISSSVYARTNYDKDDFTVTVQYGLDGIAKPDVTIPVSVKIENQGEDYSGIVRLVLPDANNGEGVAYEKEVSVASNTSKTVTMSIRSVGALNTLKVQLVDEKDEIIYSEKIKTNLGQSGDYAVLGILSDDFSALNYFDGVLIDNNYYYGNTKTAELNADIIPENGEGLAICNYILINDYNLDQLSDAQQTALANWVKNGGILIFGTGSKASTVFGNLNGELIQVNTGELHKAELAIYSSTGDTNTPIEADVVDIQMEKSLSITGVVQGADIYQETIGKGCVVVAEFNFGLEPIASWAERKTMGEQLLETIGNDYTNKLLSGTSDSNSSYELAEAIDSVDANKAPSTLLYALLFLVYVIVVGPIVYLILKVKDKREHIWIAIPIVSMLFTLLVFLSSLFYRINKPFLNEFMLVEYGEDSATTNVYFSLQSPKSKEYTVFLNQEYDHIEPLATQSYYGIIEDKFNNSYASSIQQGNGETAITTMKAQAFQKNYYTASKVDAEETGRIDVDVNGGLDGVTGKVTNNTGHTLLNAVLYYNGKYQYLGDLEDGDIVNVNPNQQQVLANVYSYNIGDYWLEGQDTFGRSREERKEYNRKTAIYEYIRTMLDYQSDYSEGIVFGIMEDYSAPITENSKVKEYQGAVAVRYFKEEIAEYGGIYIDNMNDFAQDNGKDWNGEDCISWEQSLEVNYQLPAYALEGHLYATEHSGNDNYADADANVYLYNFTTSNYDQVFVDTNRIANMIDYISGEGTIRIRYDAPSADDYTIQLPQIALIGGQN